MKTYTVTFKYETYANYTVEAQDRDEAENIALDLLKNDEGDYLHHGSWTDTEVEEVKTPIGAIATIQFDNEPEPIEGYYFSFGDYDEDTNSDSFGVNDHRVFYYAQGEADMIALSKPNGGDFVILSYELEFQP